MRPGLTVAIVVLALLVAARKALAVDRLGQYFTLSELTRSATATAEGIDNSPNAAQTANLRALVQNVLDPLRGWLGVPIHVTSGFRSSALNAAINGADNSQHSRGEAADIRVSGMSSPELAEKIVEARSDGAITGYDQLIHYGQSGHVHISWDPDGSQRQAILYSPSPSSYQGSWIA